MTTSVTEPGATPGQGGGIGPVLRNRRFVALWLAQVASLLAANMALYALTLLCFAAGGGNSTSVSILFLCFLGPAIVLSAPAGVIVDRFDRRAILLGTNVVRAGSFGLLVIAAGNLPLAYLLVAATATATTLFIPAEAAMIPRVVPREQLLAANGLFTFTLQAAFAVGFAVLGPIGVQVVGPSATVAVAAILYLVAGGLCLALPPAPPERDVHGAAEGAVGMREQFGEGISVARSDPAVRWPLILLGFTAALVGVLGVLGPTVAVTQLRLGEQEFFLLVLPLAVGLVIGVALLGPLSRRVSHRRLGAIGLGGIAVGLAGLAALRPLAALLGSMPRAELMIAMPVAVGVGAAYALVAVPAQTDLQEALPDAVRGRVFAVLNLLVNTASAIPIILIGPAADALGIPAVVGGFALATAGLAVAGAWGRVPVGRRRPADERGMVVAAASQGSLSPVRWTRGSIVGKRASLASVERAWMAAHD
jgi:MFS family permease